MKMDVNMNMRNTRPLPTLAALLLAGAMAPAMAQTTPASAAHDASAHGSHHAPQGAPATAGAEAAALSEGEITRWDPRTLRVTLRHGEIKNLEMPPMTMVFRVQDASLLDGLKAGDKVRFRAERVNGTYQVTRIEKAS